LFQLPKSVPIHPTPRTPSRPLSHANPKEGKVRKGSRVESGGGLDVKEGRRKKRGKKKRGGGREGEVCWFFF